MKFFSWMQRGIRGCSKGATDAAREPRMQPGTRGQDSALPPSPVTIKGHDIFIQVTNAVVFIYMLGNGEQGGGLARSTQFLGAI